MEVEKLLVDYNEKVESQVRAKAEIDKLKAEKKAARQELESRLVDLCNKQNGEIKTLTSRLAASDAKAGMLEEKVKMLEEKNKGLEIVASKSQQQTDAVSHVFSAVNSAFDVINNEMRVLASKVDKAVILFDMDDDDNDDEEDDDDQIEHDEEDNSQPNTVPTNLVERMLAQSTNLKWLMCFLSLWEELSADREYQMGAGLAYRDGPDTYVIYHLVKNLVRKHVPFTSGSVIRRYLPSQKNFDLPPPLRVVKIPDVKKLIDSTCMKRIPTYYNNEIMMFPGDTYDKLINEVRTSAVYAPVMQRLRGWIRKDRVIDVPSCLDRLRWNRSRGYGVFLRA